MWSIDVFFFSIFLYHTGFVSSVIYSCDSNAECGCSKVNANLDKIVGGEPAINSSWGWSASLQTRNGRHFCGGIIISPLHIITAAHCVTDSSEIIRNARVVVGIDILSQSASSIAQVCSIVRVISHPEYNSSSKSNDIAVLQLNQSLNISNEKGTARLCLPYVNSSDAAYNYPVPDTSLIAIGWGKLHSSELVIPFNRHLQQVTVNSMSATHSMCRLVIHNPQLQFCAGVMRGGKGITLLDTCQGDSGGPLMHFELNKRQWVLAGITSYGRDCAAPDNAGVYTRVSVYYNWLRLIVTDSFVESVINITTTKLPELATNLTSTTLSDSATSISSWYRLIVLSLYVFIQS